jgi:hypothetical protein
LDLENVEEIFSLASGSGDPTLMKDATLAIAATLDYAETVYQPVRSKVLAEQTDDPGVVVPLGWEPTSAIFLLGLRKEDPKLREYSCPAYDFYALVLSGGCTPLPKGRRDTVITFNYDMLVEKALRNLSVPFHYGFKKYAPDFDDSFVVPKGPRTESVPVLKLHGSVNWAVSDKGLGIYGDYTDVRKLPLAGPMLVPPTWNKSIGPALSDVWDSAVGALRTATRIVVIGYSIPVNDNDFKYLLATGLQENVSLRKIIFVNPDSVGISNRLPNLLRPELNSRIVEIIPSDTASFFGMQRARIERDLVGTFRASRA